MPSQAAVTIVIYDPPAGRDQSWEEGLTACGLTPKWIVDGEALSQLRRAADDCAVALVAVDGVPSGSAHAIEAIARLKHRGYIVLCYADGAANWSLGRQCRLLLAGAEHLLDSSKAGFCDDLRQHVTRVIGAERDRRDDEQRLKEQMRAVGMAGDSACINGVFRWILRVSPLSELPVLLSGETGTGKELVARAIHRLDPRRANSRFIAVNCGAISAGIAESELFGHRRGAFTGAEHERAGLVRAARGGILFLDEIGDLEPGLQSKLLRVLQEHRVLALGEDHEVEVDVRIIAATNHSLDDMVRAHTFRADLFHRLNVLSFRLPALRERPEDIEPLVRHFVTRYGNGEPADDTRISKEFVQALRRVDLPGNIRQLENIVRRALVTRERGKPLSLSDLPPELLQEIVDAKDATTPAHDPSVGVATSVNDGDDDADANGRTTQALDMMSILAASRWKLTDALDLCEQRILSAALDASSGNRSRAARLLGISARSIFNKMRKHRLTN